MSSLKDDIRVVVAIDFGTTYSGYAFAHKFNPKKEIIVGREYSDVGYKAPTILKYEDESCSTIKSWGFEAVAEKPSRRKKKVDHSKLVELFKLYLLKEPSMKLPVLPDKLDYKKAIADYLKELAKMIKEKVEMHWKVDFYSQVLIVLTIPAEFDDDAIAIMRDCAYNAGLTREKDSRFLIFTTEPEAAAIHCLKYSEKLSNLKPGDSFMVADCGGGTVDLISHELLTDNRLSEITERTGGNCGSSFVDKEYIKFLRRKLGNSTIELLEKEHYDILQYMVQKFCGRVKIPFTGEKSEFSRYEVDLNEFKIIKEIIEEGKVKQLEEAEWSIYVEFGDVKGMFDHCITKIIHMIRGQLAQLQSQRKKCSAMMLVGGFSESEYLQSRIKKEFSKIVPIISVPSQPLIAVVMGGVQFGLQAETVVNRVLKRTYGTENTRRTLSGDPSSQILPNGLTIIFETLAKRGKKISVNDKEVKKFKPLSLTQRNISFDIYVTKEFDAKFCDDPGVSLLRSWKMELPKNENYEDIIILFTLTFGTVEILATAETENQKTRKKEQIKLKYE